MQKQKLFTIAQAADYLHVDERTLNRWLKQGQIQPRQDQHDKRRRLITASQIRRLEEAHPRSQPLPDNQTMELRQEIASLKQEIIELKERYDRLQRHVDDLAELTHGHGVTTSHPHTDASDSAGIIPDLMRRGPNDAMLPLRVRDTIRAAIGFIRRATREHVSPPNSRQIYVIHQRDHSIFTAAPELRAEWWRVLRGAIDHGWELVHLIRRAQDADDSEHAATSRMLAKALMVLLGGTGNYVPQYFYLRPEVRQFYPQPFDPRNLREIIVVSGQGGGEMYSMTAGESFIDQFEECVAGDERFASLATYANEAFLDSGRVIQSHEKGSVKFADAMAFAERESGGRVLFMRGLSQSTIPWDIHRHRAASVADQVWARKMVKSLKSRESALIRKLRQGFSVREICTSEAVAKYAITGIYAEDDPFIAKGGREIRPSERRQHLQSIIDRLNTFDNYELALVGEDDLKKSGVNLSTWWMVKENFSVLLEAWRHTTATPPAPVEIDLEIKDQDIVATLWDYFQKEIWPALPEYCTDRKSVVRQLKQQMSRIPQDS